ncbi:MAG: hypothetical protein ABW026_15055 [Microvirga sp.]
MLRIKTARHAVGIPARSLAIAWAALPASAADGPTAIRLPDTGRFPENVTSLADGTLFVSIIADGGVLRIAGGVATATPSVKPGEHGKRSTFGLLADERRGTLWVASHDAIAIVAPRPTPTEGGWSKAFDLASGTLKLSLRLPGGKALSNDFALDGDGALYVTDTLAPRILRLKPGATLLSASSRDGREAPSFHLRSADVE